MIVSSKKRLVLWVSLAISAILLCFACFFPLPYYVEAPGFAPDVRAVLTVDGKTDQEAGGYHFVYVSVKQATAMDLLWASLDSNQTIRSKEEENGGATSEEVQQMNQLYMQASQDIAKYQALTLAEEPVKLVYSGVYILSIADDSTFQGILEIGDTVTKVDGRSFQNTQEMIDYVSSLSLDQEVTVDFLRKGHAQTAKGKIIRLSNGKNGLGISLTDHTEIQSSHQIEMDTGQIGGPSAGLMFTLSIYTQLHEPDLRDGRVIAGTGTIQSDGTVGEIGGIDKKVISAEQAGATIFFAPNQPIDPEVLKKDPKAKNNYQEALESAQRNHLSIQIVPVKTVEDAIQYLRKTKSS